MPAADSKTANPRFLTCRPEHFSIEYEINAWMKGNLHRSHRDRAAGQWQALHDQLARVATIEAIEPAKHLPDLVFTANAGLVVNNRVVLSHFRHPERQKEEPHNKQWFERQGFEVITMPKGTFFEGAGDALFLRDRPVLVMGYGLRTSLDAASFLRDKLKVRVLPLRLIDERFYHLDTCFCPLEKGHLIYYPAAFDKRSLAAIEELVPEDRRFAVSERDALDFACNAVSVGDHIILNNASSELEAVLRDWGYQVVKTPLDEFMLAGGSAKCLTLRLDEKPAAPTVPEEIPDPVVTRQVEFKGHIVDNGTMTRVMDMIPILGGAFRLVRFDPGVRKEDPSWMVIEVLAPTRDVLQDITLKLLSLGGRLLEPESTAAETVRVTKQGVAPRNFYSTTIFRTEVLYRDQWLTVQGQRMDAVVAIDESGPTPTAHCRLIRDLQPGDIVVTGSEGIRIHAKHSADIEEEEFKFMGSSVSSERRVEAAVDQIAWEMKRIKERGGRIIVVPGPVVIHTGGAPHLGRLVRKGYIHALLSGNAVAVHDLEHALYGTSLGVDLKRGVPVAGGHRHHINAINIIRECGGIRQAVEQGVITSGLFYDIVKAGVPYCLAGSIRDDGPLPDTEMDLVKAQAEYTRLLRGAEMILMLSTMLHSIGVGNMTPAGVRMICVDINPAVATKLADRGSVESTPIVTDVGLFLNMLARKIENLEES